jgi:hypothetical protein
MTIGKLMIVLAFLALSLLVVIPRLSSSAQCHRLSVRQQNQSVTITVAGCANVSPEITLINKGTYPVRIFCKGPCSVLQES